MRKYLLFGLPLVLAIAGLAYLVVSIDSGQPTGTAATGDGWRTPTKAEKKKFHYVPGIGPRAREVPGSNGTEWEQRPKKGGPVYRVHGHTKPNPGAVSFSGKVVVRDQVRDGSAKGGVSKVVSAYTGDDAPDADEVLNDPPEWRVDDWIGDGMAGATGQYECASSGPRLELIYAHPEPWDRFDKAERDREKMVQAMAATMSHSSVLRGGPSTVKIRVVCEGGKPKISNLEFPKSPAGVKPDLGTHRCGFLWLWECENESDGQWSYSELNYSIGDAAEVLQEEGFWEDDVTYTVFWDGPTEGGTSWGYTPQDDSASPSTDAIMSLLNIDYWSGIGPLHEYLHTLGAVQDSAPHNYNGGHCSDGIDVMCYGTSVDSGGEYSETSCAADQPQTVDCGGDDYFNPLPRPGSYLTNHRNTANLGYMTYEGENRCSWVTGGGDPRLACGAPDITLPPGTVLDEDRGGTTGGGATGSPGLTNVPVG